MLKQTDTMSYTWTSRELTLEHADPATAARAGSLRVAHAPPGVLRGIERFTELGVLEVIVDAPLDLSPLCADLRELWAVDLDLHAGVTGEHGLAELPAFGLYLTGDAEQLPAVVAGLAWERMGTPTDVHLIARGGAFVVDVTPLGALTSLECLVGKGVVLGPRDISGEDFAALLPPRLHTLHSAHADEEDRRRFADAWAARPPPPRDAAGEPSFFSYNDDRVRLDASAADPLQDVWSQDPEDRSWTLELDVVPIVGGDPDDGEVNYRAQALTEEELRRKHPALAERVEDDTTAEALFLTIATGDDEDRDRVDQAVRAAITALQHE